MPHILDFQNVQKDIKCGYHKPGQDLKLHVYTHKDFLNTLLVNFAV